jgi:hypothetical protein
VHGVTDLTNVLERLQAQQAAMQSLFSAVEQGLADVNSSLERGNVILGALGAMEAAIADMTAAVEGSSAVAAIDRLTAAVATMRAEQAPTVNVEAIMPAPPAPIVHMMHEEHAGAVWRVEMPGRFVGDSPRIMVITRTA